MADESSSTNALTSGSVLGLMGLLILLMVGFGANLYLLIGGSPVGQVKTAADLEAAAQSITKHTAMIAGGNTSVVGSLTSDKEAFSGALAALRSGDVPESAQASVNQISSLWNDLSMRVDLVIEKSSAIDFMKETSADLNINLQLIQQENNKTVRAMLRQNAAPNEIVTAQRQALIIERIGHTVDKIIDRGGDQSMADQYRRDSQQFATVLRGLRNGDQNLALSAQNNGEIRGYLTRMESLFASVRTGVDGILERSADLSEINTASAAAYETAAEFGPAVQTLTNQLGVGGTIASLPIAGAIGAAILIVFVVIVIQVQRASSSNVSEKESQNEDNQAAILQLLDELADLADGDLRVQATVTESFTGAIADSINFSIDQMRALVSKINETSGKVSSAADHTKSSVSALSEASQRQAAEIADVSEAVNVMAESIDMVSSNAAESSSVAERSVDIASKGAVVVQNTIDGMDNIRGQIQETAKRIKRLGESSQEIGDIVALINDIADQTNILSLNAAIQASMAGDAGKGFAVVADEVQRLAERSGAAAKQISALVKTIQSDTNEAVSSMEQTTAEVVQGTRLAQDAGVALGEIEGVSKSLAEIIEKISDASRQQAASAGRISKTMKSIQEITTATTDGTKQTATAVGNLAEMTNELRSSVSGFKLPE